MDKPPEDKVVNIGKNSGDAKVIPFEKHKKAKINARRNIQISKGLSDRGMLQEGWGREDDAMEDYEKALQHSPDNAEAAVNLGTIYFRRGKLREARELYKQALDIDPKYSLAWFNLGNVNEELHSQQEALICYERSIGCPTPYPAAYYNMAVLNQKMGNIMQAIISYKKFIDIADPNDSSTETARRNVERLIKGKLVTEE